MTGPVATPSTALTGADLLTAIDEVDPRPGGQRPVALGEGGLIVLAPDGGGSIWLSTYGEITIARWHRGGPTGPDDGEHVTILDTPALLEHLRRHGGSYPALVARLTAPARLAWVAEA